MRNPQRSLLAGAATALLVAVGVITAHTDNESVDGPRAIVSAGTSVTVQPALLTSGPATAAPASAEEIEEETVDALVDLNPGIGEEELRDRAEELAEQYGTTPEAILEQQLAEAEESAAAASGADGAGAPSGAAGEISFVPASSGTATVILGDATIKGDIFVSPASTLFVQHGHTGIYAAPGMVVEALGANQVSRKVAALSLKVGKGAVKQHVSTTQANRDKAANYAVNSMLKKPYNLNFVSNKHVPASSYNCSQLVWGAYKYTTNIDLDSNGGMGVYPYDIRNSSKTVTYQTR